MSDERWDQLVAAAVGGPVTPGAMFGSKGLRTGTKYFAIWWQDRLVLKLPAAGIDDLVGAGQAVAFEPMPGRRMNGWVVVGSATDWPMLAEQARGYVESQQH